MIAHRSMFIDPARLNVRWKSAAWSPRIDGGQESVGDRSTDLQAAGRLPTVCVSKKRRTQAGVVVSSCFVSTGRQTSGDVPSRPSRSGLRIKRVRFY